MRNIVTVVVLLALVALPLAAQDAPPEPGSRVRVTLTPEATARRGLPSRWETTLDGATADSLRLGATSLSWTDVRKLERQAGRKGSAGLGALIGAGTGAAAGAVWYNVASSSAGPCEGWELVCTGPGMLEGTLISAGVGAGAGALLGAVVGSLVKHDAWTTVAPPRVDVAPMVRPGGPGVAVSLRFQGFPTPRSAR